MAVIVSGEPLLSPWLLLRSLVARPGALLDSERPGSLSERLRIPSGSRLQLFAFGRQALAAALRNLGERGQILVPAYICDTVADGIKAAGWRCRYYPLGDDLEPHWSWLEANRQSADRALLLVHYFGFPSDLGRATRFARDHKLTLIEDCAHAFLTALSNDKVGRAGAASIYSWRKFLPVANGGALVARAQPDRTDERSHFGGAAATRELCKWLLFKSGSRMMLRRLGSTLSDEPDERTSGATSGVPDWIALRVLAAEVPHLRRLAQRRRENYRRLFESLSGSWNVRLLTPPPVEDAVPWCLAITVPGGASRDSLVDHFLRKGIGAWPWPELPDDVTADSFPREFRLASETICLPIHQDLGRRHMRRIAHAVANWRSRG